MDNQIYINGILNAKVNSASIHLGQAHPSRSDEVVVGFEDEAETIINRLTRGSMKLDIVSIVGMPGQGKTTLAKKVYNSPAAQYHFRKRAWCFVTQVYDVKMLLLDILRHVTTMVDDEIHNMSKDDLAQKLYKCLKGQSYLIIMDDIWDITAWNAVKESFPDDKNGSRILFTSRNKFIDNPYLLQPLSEEKSMELLKQNLLPKDSWPSNISDDVEQILKVCNGLPLAIVVVAGLLNRASNDLDQWKEIVQNLDPKLASQGCMDILELSYENLPDHLKSCFLYLGAVGRTKVFKVHKLIQLWIAEGFVEKSGIKSSEEVAREYLEDLSARSLVIVNKRSFSGGEIKECRIHDLLRELCLKKAEEERFLYFPNDPYDIYYQYRLCICNREMLYFFSKCTGSTLRSVLLPYGDLLRPGEFTASLFIRSKLLRVLDLGSVNFDDCFPKEILLLVFLRYLFIRCDMECVPSSIGNLCNLETFHVRAVWGSRRARVLPFPHTMRKMKTLRDVDVGRRAIIWLDDHDANVCPQLDNLDSFSTLYLCNVKDAEKILRGFPRVRKLKLQFSKSWDCRTDCDPFQVLHSLSKLESLNLQYPYYGYHTCAFNLPTCLKKLVLSNFRRPWSEISTIGKLPNLEVLKLLKNAIVGERWEAEDEDNAIVREGWKVEDDQFSKLKYLKLSLLCISHWEASDSSFACLERLVVRNCHFLVELPAIFGDAPTLKTIEVCGCSESLATSAESILEEQCDLGNTDLQVLIHKDRLMDDSWDLWPSPIWAQILDARVTLGIHDAGGPLELDKKGVACVKERSIRSVRRTNLVLKYNCQPRQAIMSRHTKEMVKRDG